MTAEKHRLAEKDYMSGMKYKDIAEKYSVSINTVKSWKTRHGWSKKRCTQKKVHTQSHEKSAHKKKVHGNTTAQLGNRNATGPPGNKHAERYGFFSKYLPDETKEIFDAVYKANPLDLLWHQIQIAYAAIIRAQRIAYVKDQKDATAHITHSGPGGKSYEFKEAWDKQNNFLKAQARAQGELRNLIRQYDEMLHNDWELATEEQKARVAKIKAEASRIGSDEEVEYMDDIEVVIYGDNKAKDNTL